MFGYGKDEMMGKDIAMLTPPRLRAMHIASFDLARTEKRGPNIKVPLVSFALNRNGEEIPVTVLPTGWQQDGKWFYAAEIKRR